MLAAALLCIVSALHLGDLTPRGKYYLIETQHNGQTGDVKESEDSGEDGDNDGQGDDMAIIENEDKTKTNDVDDSIKPMMTKKG